MTELCLKIIHSDGTVAAMEQGTDVVRLVYAKEYEEGDRILLESSEKNIHLLWQVDDALGSAQVYITDHAISYQIPFNEGKNSYSPKVFSGSRHYLYAQTVPESVTSLYRNLALNPADQHGDTHCYPHASANVETRGESVFAARNAIDGVTENRSHGCWPYSSWGINCDPNACFKLEFGREVSIDKIILVTRADFPHDSWWTQATFTFSDGSTIDFPMNKSTEGHVCTFDAKKVRWLTLDKLIKADDPSPFPALTQIEVFGREAD